MPATFKACIDDIGISGDMRKTIMIGDSETDFMTAVNAKVPSILFTFGYSDQPITELTPDALLDHYRYPPEAARKLVGQPL